jgi:hypothetical protein
MSISCVPSLVIFHGSSSSATHDSSEMLTKCISLSLSLQHPSPTTLSPSHEESACLC